MKTMAALLLAVATLVTAGLLTTHATSSFRPAKTAAIPSEFLGFWFILNEDAKDCDPHKYEPQGSEDMIRATTDGTEEWEGGCKLISLDLDKVAKRHTFAATFSCGQENQTWRSKEVWHLHTIDGQRILIRTSTISDQRADGRNLTTDHGPYVDVYRECKTPHPSH
jgi:hypothetical protein